MTLKKAYLTILASFVWLIGGSIILSILQVPTSGTLANILFGGLLISFAIIFILGTAIWSAAKGYHPIVGVILGWIGPCGLLILVFLPDKSIPTSP